MGEGKDLVHRMVRAMYGTRNEDAVERHFAPEMHDPIRAHRAEMLAAFPDLSVTVEDALEEDGRVFARFLLEGTHDGAYMGKPATGRRVSWTSVRVFEISDRRITGAWGMQDRLALLEQLDDSA